LDIVSLVLCSLSHIGSELAGARYHPIFASLASDAASDSLAIIASTHVTPDSGTGLVHCAPAHGADDYNLFREQGFISSTSSIVCHVGEGGLFTNEVVRVVGKEAGKTLLGQPVLDNGSRTIVDLLKYMGRLLKIERFKHRYPYDWKTDRPVIVTYVRIYLLSDLYVTLHTQGDIAMVCQFG
jgi:isoleucyl-tRNA synthetase